MWKNFVTSGRDISPGDGEYRKLYLTNTLLLTATTIFGLFSLLTFFVTEQYLIFLVDLSGMLIAAATIFYLRRGGSLIISSSVLVGLVFVLTLISIYFDTYPNMNLVWIYVMPLTAIFLLDRKWGVRVVILYSLFYLAILIEHSDIVETLNKGPVLLANLFGVLIAVTLLARYFDISRQEAQDTLETALKREATQGQKLKLTLGELSLYKHNLEIRIAEAVDDVKKKEKLLIQQSKMASMGEMIAIIAHQLKQPLSAISLVTQEAKEAYRNEELDEEYIKDLSDRTIKHIAFMAETIDDFKNFLNPNKRRECFWLHDAIKKGLDILEPQLRSEEVDVMLSGSDVELYGVIGEIQQMLINLIVNAKEVMKERGVKKKRVKISVTSNGSSAKVMVSDNGGGIDEEVIHSLFDSYVTTKEDGGTGLGLYMVKLIAQSMNGNVSVHNTEEGAAFTIEIPLGRCS